MKCLKSIMGLVLSVGLLALSPAGAQQAEFELSGGSVSGQAGQTVTLPFRLSVHLPEPFSLLGLSFSLSTSAPLSFPPAPLITTDPVLPDFPGVAGIDFNLDPETGLYSWIAPLAAPSFVADDLLTFLVPVRLDASALGGQSYTVDMLMQSLSLVYGISGDFYDPAPDLLAVGTVRVAAVSAPSTAALLGLACLAAGLFGRRRADGASALRAA